MSQMQKKISFALTSEFSGLNQEKNKKRKKSRSVEFEAYSHTEIIFNILDVFEH